VRRAAGCLSRVSLTVNGETSDLLKSSRRQNLLDQSKRVFARFPVSPNAGGIAAGNFPLRRAAGMLALKAGAMLLCFFFFSMSASIFFHLAFRSSGTFDCSLLLFARCSESQARSLSILLVRTTSTALSPSPTCLRPLDWDNRAQATHGDGANRPSYYFRQRSACSEPGLAFRPAARGHWARLCPFLLRRGSPSLAPRAQAELVAEVHWCACIRVWSR